MSYAYTSISRTDAPSLEAAAHLAMAQHPRMRVIVFDWNGARHVLKRMARKPRPWPRRFMLRSLLRLAFPGYVRGGRFGFGDGLFEAGRIAALAQAGMRVPAIELKLSEAVVYSHCGEPLRQYLKSQSAAERERLLLSACRDLAAFHSAGHWHGGAQLRNVLVQGGPGQESFCRIDFEEDLEGLLSLPLLQVYDLGLFVVEALRFFEGEAALALGERLCATYRTLHWSAGHQAIWRRITRILRALAWLDPLLRRLNHPEGNRVLVLGQLLRRLEDAGFS